MLELRFEALTCWLSDEELSRFCRSCQVVVPGFRAERAPRPLQIAALNRDTANAHYYRYNLARGWQQRYADLWQEIEAFVAERLDKEPELNPAPWLIDLGRRHGTTKALLTAVFYSETLIGLYERFFNDDTWSEVAAAWHDQNLAERDAYLARQAAEAAAAEAAAGVVAAGSGAAAAQSAGPPIPAAARPEPGRALAAEARRLQQSVKQLTHEKKALARELTEAEARRRRAEQERERLLALWTDLTQRRQWPHPVERTRRLLQALAAAWGEPGQPTVR